MASAPLDIQGQQKLAADIRASIVEISYKAGVGHIGSALSVTDLLAALYGRVLRIDPANPTAAERDRFILSKGHASAALYSTLALRGFIDVQELDRYGAADDGLCLHPERGSLPGIEFSTGSLGHGLSVSAGMAMGLARTHSDARVFIIMSDGEINEGSVWEAAMFAAHHKLHRLVAIIDANQLQATGPTHEVLDMSPLADKWRAFGWDTHEVDGHDIAAVNGALDKAVDCTDAPSIIIANTVKGKGIDFMENEMTWHYFSLNEDTYARARAALAS